MQIIKFLFYFSIEEKFAEGGSDLEMSYKLIYAPLGF